MDGVIPAGDGQGQHGGAAVDEAEVLGRNVTGEEQEGLCRAARSRVSVAVSGDCSHGAPPASQTAIPVVRALHSRQVGR